MTVACRKDWFAGWKTHWVCACEEKFGDAWGMRRGKRAWQKVGGGQTCMSLSANALMLLVKKCECVAD